MPIARTSEMSTPALSGNAAVEPSKPTASGTSKRGARVPTYVYTKRSRSSGRELWYGDFRRYRAVGGRLEPLAQYLHPDERIL